MIEVLAQKENTTDITPVRKSAVKILSSTIPGLGETSPDPLKTQQREKGKTASTLPTSRLETKQKDEKRLKMKSS